MYTIKTMNKISAVGLSRLPQETYTVDDNAAAPQAILVRSAKMHDYPFENSLLAIARAGAGVNNIPVADCAERGIVVFNTPGANANAVKELVLLSLLLSSRRVPDALEWVKAQKDQPDVAKACEKGKAQFVGPEIAGKTLGVIGLGAIGVRVANAAIHLGMNVCGYDPFVSLNNAWELSRHVQHISNLDDMFANCDYLTLHVPATKDTTGMVNAQNLAKMKDGVRIINLARGELVNNADLLAAVASGKVARYVTDFAAPELIGAENVVVFPHLGASTPESEDNCASMAADEIMDYLENGNITHSVNLPDASMPRAGAVRVCVIHKNVANMLSAISASVSAGNTNIANLLNKSRGEIAYTMIDLDADPGDIEQKLAGIDGIIRTRVLR